jgi:sortase B
MNEENKNKNIKNENKEADKKSEAQIKEKRSGKRASSDTKKWKWLILLITAAVIALFVILFVILPMMAEEEPVKTFEPSPTIEETAAPSPSPFVMLPQMKELYDKNSDLAGWIKIEGAEGDEKPVIDYPVMYTPNDGEFYLYKTFEKKQDPTKKGNLFIDKNCTIDPRSTNLIIHGHNMKNGTMFHNLIEYKKEDFYKEHPAFSYTTLYEEQEYQIVSVFLSRVYKKSDDVFKFYQFYNAETKEEFDYFVKNIKEMELYETGVTPEFGDELITLTTCEYSQSEGRIVVVGRRVKD